MTDLATLTARLRENRDLETTDAAAAGHLLASADADPADKEAFLTALAVKGETAEEIAGLAETFRGLARDPGVHELAPRAIDVCGTGGDKLGTFNISTTVLFVLAADGVPVFKHGNRSITSKCGSAELLGALGVPLEADNGLLQASLRELNFAFFFAPAFHPAFKNIMPVRQALAAKGQRTVFNILGPLINPGRPAYQLLGVFSETFLPAMASALDAMSLKNGYAVHCRLADGRGMDELSTAGVNAAVGFGQSQGRNEEWKPEDFGLSPAPMDDLLGGDLEANLELFNRVLEGTAPSGLVDTVCLNAGAAFHVAGRADSIRDGIARARDVLGSGRVKEQVRKTADFYRS